MEASISGCLIWGYNNTPALTTLIKGVENKLDARMTFFFKSMGFSIWMCT